MSLPTNPTSVRTFQAFASLAGALNVALGGVVLLAWTVGWHSRFVTNWQEQALMRPLVALGLLLGGLGLLLWRHGRAAMAERLAVLCGLGAMAIGLLAVAEHVSGRELGASLLLFPTKLKVLAMAHPGRPSFQAGLSLTLNGLALALYRRRPLSGVRPTELLSGTAILMPFLGLSVYAYHLEALYGPFGALRTVSLSMSSLGLAVLSLGVLASCPERGWTRHLTSAGPGGVVLRRMLPAFIGVPVLAGLLALTARVTLKPITTSLEMLVLALAGLVLVLILRSGVKLDQLEAKRRAAEAELAARAETLHESNERLQAIDRLKTDFMNAVSHELRTPLTSIRGFAEFLEDEIGGRLAPQQRGFVAEIQTNAERLQRLVDDLLDYARLEAGTFRLTLATGDLEASARLAVSSLMPAAHHAGIDLALEAPESPLTLTMDGGRIEQVLINLVGNALKFTRPGGRVRIRLERRPDEVWVGVEDTGIGIAPEAQAHLFDKFYQVDNTSTRARGGAGLGLSISKALVEAHGGHIGVTSTPGEGSTFWFTLPYTAAEPVPTPVA